MKCMDSISLTRELLSFNTVNPPGNEQEIALFVGQLLEGNGFKIEYHPLDAKRLTLIAEKGLSNIASPLVLSGHFDTVPLGAKQWSVGPFSGEMIDGKIYGRGSSDMKSGIAAIIVASVQAFEEGVPEGGVRLIFTAGEELGCQGAQHLVRTYRQLGEASALIVGEPTANIPVIGHKGGLYLNVSTCGVTAHSSMPELGDNAIYKAARAILKIEDFSFGVDRDPLLGLPTINVGKVSGGMNLNSVPDHAEFTIDVRSTGKITHAEIMERLKAELGNEATIEILVNMAPVSSKEDDPFIRLVYDVCQVDRSDGAFPKALPYLTDGSVLQHYYNGIPTVILGPGQPEMAHQTDEFCYVGNIEKSVTMYKNIILKRRINND